MARKPIEQLQAEARLACGLKPLKTQRKERLCLRCGTKFDSKGPENRICPECTAWDKENETSDL